MDKRTDTSGAYDPGPLMRGGAMHHRGMDSYGRGGSRWPEGYDNFALAWCEDRLLAKTNLNQNTDLAGSPAPPESEPPGLRK